MNLRSYKSKNVSTGCTKNDPRGFLHFLTTGIRSTSIMHLDGLRGVAVLLVVFGHCCVYSPKFGPLFSAIAKHGVWLFFILSSFLLTFLLSDRISMQNMRLSLATYAFRRLIRIFPMYFFSLILLLLFPSFVRMMFGDQSFSLVKHIFLLYPIGNYWAISVEFEYYFIIPIICIIFSWLSSALHRTLYLFFLMLTAFFCDVIFRRYFVFPPNFPHLPPYLGIFLIGSIIALYYRMIIDNQFSAIPQAIIMLLQTATLIFWISTVPFIGPFICRTVWNESLYHFMARPFNISLMYALLLFTSLLGGTWFRAILVFPFLRFVGIISYSIYLLHIFILGIVLPYTYNQIGYFASAVAALLCILFSCSLTYYFIERPFMQLRFNNH